MLAIQNKGIYFLPLGGSEVTFAQLQSIGKPVQKACMFLTLKASCRKAPPWLQRSRPGAPQCTLGQVQMRSNVPLWLWVAVVAREVEDVPNAVVLRSHYRRLRRTLFSMRGPKWSAFVFMVENCSLPFGKRIYHDYESSPFFPGIFHNSPEKDPHQRSPPKIPTKDPHQRSPPKIPTKHPHQTSPEPYQKWRICREALNARFSPPSKTVDFF